MPCSDTPTGWPQGKVGGWDQSPALGTACVSLDVPKAPLTAPVVVLNRDDWIDPTLPPPSPHPQPSHGPPVPSPAVPPHQALSPCHIPWGPTNSPLLRPQLGITSHLPPWR